MLYIPAAVQLLKQLGFPRITSPLSFQWHPKHFIFLYCVTVEKVFFLEFLILILVCFLICLDWIIVVLIFNISVLVLGGADQPASHGFVPN